MFDRNLDAGDFSGVQVLYVPNPDSLSAKQRANVATFEAKGGKVIRHRPEWNWSGEPSTGPTQQGFLGLVRRAATIPLSVFVGPADMVTGYFMKDKDQIVTIASDGSWVKTGGADADNEIAKNFTRPAGPMSGVQVFVSGTRPKRAVEIVTGRVLEILPFNGGYRIALPTIEHLAVVKISR